MNDILDVDEAAEYLRINEQTLRRLARDGEIPSFKVGRTWRFKKSTLDQWAEGQSKPPERKHLLIVDDEPGIHSVLKHIFAGIRNLEMSDAYNGEEALAVMGAHQVDLVLLDLVMPYMNGAETLKRIRQLRKDLPVVLMTGYPDSALISEALPYVPVTLLSKPFSQEQLFSCVTPLLQGVFA